MVFIRPAKKSDLESLNLLLQRLSKFTPSHHILSQSLQDIQESGAVVFVATEDERIIGTASIYFIRKIRGGLVGMIEDVAVSESYERKGVGTKLICKLLDTCKLRNCYQVKLCTSVANAPFYESLGFTARETEFYLNL